MPLSRGLDLSHDRLNLTFSLENGVVPDRWTSPFTGSWIDPSSTLFAVTTRGRTFDARTPDVSVRGVRVDRTTDQSTHAVITLGDGWPLEIDLHVTVYPGTSLLEQWITVRNVGAESVRIDRIDSFALHLPPGGYELLSFSSGWGAEFEDIRAPLHRSVVLESRSGRSSNGMHPFFVLSRGDEMLSASVAWSGNWTMRLQPDETGYSLSGGLHDWEFFHDLRPGEEIEAPHVMVVLAAGDLDDIAQQFHRVGRRHWYPGTGVARSLLLEWNHWWSYEDRVIDEAVFGANVEAATRLGLELCTLDAGWFGSSEADTSWTDHRGDWDRVNVARFPSGIRARSDHAHAHGVLFGLWCEIEGLGARAETARTHPQLAASRDGMPLGYVCFGSPAAQDWALSTLERLADDYRCDWIKLDFNVDPGAGCNRSDHGHGPGDGLYAHYRGYYAVLSRFRSRHRDVVLESCSSGGLRIDLGIMRHTHLTFLSDPDWPEHNLQVFWGATMMLAPEVCLHWGPSQWLTPHPNQTFDPRDPALARQELDYHIRTTLLGVPGFSLRLPDLPVWVAERIAVHARLYKECIRAFVRDGTLYRLTDQPGRDGGGDRWCAFQYSLPSRHLMFVFRLPGGEAERELRFRALDPAATYRLAMVDDDAERLYRGDDLMREGIRVGWLDERDSTIITLREEPADQ
jgi:alpha-galactosidase